MITRSGKSLESAWKTDVEGRLRKLERFMNWTVGAGVIVGMVLGAVSHKLLPLLGL